MGATLKGHPDATDKRETTAEGSDPAPWPGNTEQPSVRRNDLTRVLPAVPFVESII